MFNIMYGYWFHGSNANEEKPEETMLKSFFRGVMGILFLFVFLFVFACFCSCASHKKAVNETTHQQDSVDVKVRIETVYVPDTVFVEIPAQKAERTTADSTSHLENDYAVSDARINEDGTLSHSLETKPQQKPVEFQKPVERRDSTVYRYRNIFKTKTITKTITKTVEVKRDYTWWDRTRFYLAYTLLICISLWILKKYKGGIISLIIGLFRG